MRSCSSSLRFETMNQKVALEIKYTQSNSSFKDKIYLIDKDLGDFTTCNSWLAQEVEHLL